MDINGPRGYRHPFTMIPSPVPRPAPGPVTALAPGSVGNLGPGLDVLGLALSGPGDSVTATRAPRPGITVTATGHPDLPDDPTRHSAALAARQVLTRAGLADTGITLAVTKGLPLAGGQGGSAASAVAGAVAVNALLGSPLDVAGLLASALDAEEAVAGRHADNVAPSLLGGIVLVRSLDPLDVIRLPVPAGLLVVLAQPGQSLTTANARQVLPAQVPLQTAIHQSAQVGAIVAALASGDLALLGRAIDDRIAEPVRAHLLPGFREAREAAIGAGALGASISGAGPTAFALCDDPATARAVAVAMLEAYAAIGVRCRTRVAEVDLDGARVVEG